MHKDHFLHLLLTKVVQIVVLEHATNPRQHIHKQLVIRKGLLPLTHNLHLVVVFFDRLDIIVCEKAFDFLRII